MVSMSGTSTAVSVADEKPKITGAAGGVAGDKMDKMGKKRTADDAGLDDGTGDAEKVGDGREWVLKKVEEMEKAFKVSNETVGRV